MKRHSILTAWLIASLAMTSSCSSHQPPHIEIPDTEPDQSVEIDNTDSADAPSAIVVAPEETSVTQAPAYISTDPAAPEDYPSSYVANANIRVDVILSERDPDTAVFYIPKLRADSEDSERINGEINEFAESLIGDSACIGADFIYFRNSDMVFSVLITGHMDDGSCVYKSYTFDTTEGTEFSNYDILSFVELSEEGFYSYASSAVRKLLSSEDSAKDATFSDTDLNPDSDLGISVASSEASAAAYAETFSEDNINVDMDIFIDETGSICFCSNVIEAENGAVTPRAYTSSGVPVRTTTSSLVYGSACTADVNFDNMAEYITVADDGSVTVNSIAGGELTELITIPSSSLGLATAYMYEESGYVGARVLRAELINDGSTRSYEIIVISTQNEITYDKVISWNDSNNDGIIAEEDSFSIDSEITDFTEWYDLTGIC